MQCHTQDIFFSHCLPQEIFLSESNLIVLDCEKKILYEVLKQCQQVRQGKNEGGRGGMRLA